MRKIVFVYIFGAIATENHSYHTWSLLKNATSLCSGIYVSLCMVTCICDKIIIMQWLVHSANDSFYNLLFFGIL